MTQRRLSPKVVFWLLAAVLLAAQAMAFAHELQHDLRLHNDAACVLHLHAQQAGQPAAEAFVALAPGPVAPPPPRATAQFRAPIALGYHTRAPPSSVRSNSAQH